MAVSLSVENKQTTCQVANGIEDREDESAYDSEA